MIHLFIPFPIFIMVSLQLNSLNFLDESKTDDHGEEEEEEMEEAEVTTTPMTTTMAAYRKLTVSTISLSPPESLL